MAHIHPTAMVDRRTELADDVQVEAYAIIGPGVSIGAGTVVAPHTVIHGPTLIGSGCRLGPGAYVGLDAQHLEFLKRPEAERHQSWLVIGNDTTLREMTSVHRSTRPGQENATRIGNNCMLMGAAHVAHDCVLADNVVMAHAALLGGHCKVAERVFLGGGCTIHQHCRIGRLAMIAGNQGVGHDVPPFASLLYGGLKGYNAVGCRRAGISREAIKSIRAVYHCIHTHRATNAAVAAMKAEGLDGPEVREILEFIAAAKRGIQPSVKFLNYLRLEDDEE